MGKNKLNFMFEQGQKKFCLDRHSTDCHHMLNRLPETCLRKCAKNLSYPLSCILTKVLIESQSTSFCKNFLIPSWLDDFDEIVDILLRPSLIPPFFHIYASKSSCERFGKWNFLYFFTWAIFSSALWFFTLMRRILCSPSHTCVTSSYVYDSNAVFAPKDT